MGKLGRVATGSAIDKDAIGPQGYFHVPQWHRPLPARGQAADLPALAPPSAEQTRPHDQRFVKNL
jgi:hypothetical protein